MSVESMAKALRVTGLTPSEKLVLIGIANHDGDGGAWPSIATLATYNCSKERAVQYVIAKLVAKGFVTVETNAGGNDRTRSDRRPNRYTLHLDGVQPTASRDDDGVQSHAQRGAILMPDGVQPIASEPSIEPSIEPSKTRASVEDEEIADREGIAQKQRAIEFERFWEGYPRKVSKFRASKAWDRLKPVDRLAAQLGLEPWVLHWKQARTEEQFIPHASTWLNGHEWENPPLTTQPGQVIIELDHGYRRNTIDGSYWHPGHRAWIEDRNWLARHRAK